MMLIDYNFVLIVYGVLVALMAAFSIGLGWQFTRESRRELKETIIIQGERTNRLIREWRAEARETAERHSQWMRDANAHIGMILERIDRGH